MPRAAPHDAARRPLTATKRAELGGVISTKPGLNRYLRVTPGGLLRIDDAAIKAEENLDGKYLLRTSDPKLPAEDIALGYKQLLEVERGWRDLKQVIDLRPVYHDLSWTRGSGPGPVAVIGPGRGGYMSCSSWR
jgi:hypothetical protein